MQYKKEEIKKIIPHRDPMLFVDEVIDMIPGESIETKFYISPDMELFRGHFPDSPVFPGVLTVEAMAQAADILLLSSARYAGKIPYFIGIDGVSLKMKILPGNTINIKANIIKENMEKAVVTCEATVFNEGQIAAHGQVTLAMR